MRRRHVQRAGRPVLLPAVPYRNLQHRSRGDVVVDVHVLPCRHLPDCLGRDVVHQLLREHLQHLDRRIPGKHVHGLPGRNLRHHQRSVVVHPVWRQHVQRRVDDVLHELPGRQQLLRRSLLVHVQRRLLQQHRPGHDAGVHCVPRQHVQQHHWRNVVLLLHCWLLHRVDRECVRLAVPALRQGNLLDGQRHLVLIVRAQHLRLEHRQLGVHGMPGRHVHCLDRHQFVLQLPRLRRRHLLARVRGIVPGLPDQHVCQ